MVVNYVPSYPILYDWLIVGIMSISLILFQVIYTRKHRGYVSLLVSEIMIIAICLSWNNIFMETASRNSYPLTTFQQVLILAPIFGGAFLTIFNVSYNHNTNKERELDSDKSNKE